MPTLVPEGTPIDVPSPGGTGTPTPTGGTTPTPEPAPPPAPTGIKPFTIEQVTKSAVRFSGDYPVLLPFTRLGVRYRVKGAATWNFSLVEQHNPYDAVIHGLTANQAYEIQTFIARMGSMDSGAMTGTMDSGAKTWTIDSGISGPSGLWSVAPQGPILEFSTINLEHSIEPRSYQEVNVQSAGEHSITISGKVDDEWTPGQEVRVFFYTVPHDYPQSRTVGLETLVATIQPQADGQFSAVIDGLARGTQYRIGLNYLVSDDDQKHLGKNDVIYTGDVLYTDGIRASVRGTQAVLTNDNTITLSGKICNYDFNANKYLNLQGDETLSISYQFGGQGVRTAKVAILPGSMTIAADGTYTAKIHLSDIPRQTYPPLTDLTVSGGVIFSVVLTDGKNILDDDGALIGPVQPFIVAKPSPDQATNDHADAIQTSLKEIQANLVTKTFGVSPYQMITVSGKISNLDPGTGKNFGPQTGQMVTGYCYIEGREKVYLDPRYITIEPDDGSYRFDIDLSGILGQGPTPVFDHEAINIVVKVSTADGSFAQDNATIILAAGTYVSPQAANSANPVPPLSMISTSTTPATVATTPTFPAIIDTTVPSSYLLPDIFSDPLVQLERTAAITSLGGSSSGVGGPQFSSNTYTIPALTLSPYGSFPGGYLKVDYETSGPYYQNPSNRKVVGRTIFTKDGARFERPMLEIKYTPDGGHYVIWHYDYHFIPYGGDSYVQDVAAYNQNKATAWYDKNGIKIGETSFSQDGSSKDTWYSPPVFQSYDKRVLQKLEVYRGPSGQLAKEVLTFTDGTQETHDYNSTQTLGPDQPMYYESVAYNSSFPPASMSAPRIGDIITETPQLLVTTAISQPSLTTLPFKQGTIVAISSNSTVLYKGKQVHFYVVDFGIPKTMETIGGVTYNWYWPPNKSVYVFDEDTNTVVPILPDPSGGYYATAAPYNSSTGEYLL